LNLNKFRLGEALFAKSSKINNVRRARIEKNFYLSGLIDNLIFYTRFADKILRLLFLVPQIKRGVASLIVSPRTVDASNCVLRQLKVSTDLAC
jgi:hypothetical protein